MREEPAWLQAERQRITADRLESERAATRDIRRELLLAGAKCIGWCAVGSFMIGEALHVSDPQIGQIWFWSGLAAGYSGILYTVLRLYRRGLVRGYWT